MLMHALLCALTVLLVQPPRATRVTLESEGGWRLVGDFAAPPAGERRPAVLLLHGAARDRRAYIPLAQALAARGIASLRLDLRGEGESTNLGRFEPGAGNALIAGAHHDVRAALAWLASQPGIDPERVGALGASFSGETLARAARDGATAAAYVALSPGDFSDESAAAIDQAGRPWWFIASRDERFAHVVVRGIPAKSRTAQVTLVDGTSHASDILSPHFLLNQEIADWFAAALAGRRAPRLWGGLAPGAYDVGFRRESTMREGTEVIVDVWYPAVGGQAPMSFGDYLKRSTDLRGAAAGFPESADAVRASLAIAISGEAGGVSPAAVGQILEAPMAGGTGRAAAAGRFPLVLWTPRYATTAAQSVLSEYLASRGFVVAAPRPAQGGRLPFELTSAAAKGAELADRVGDMRAAAGHLQAMPFVNPDRMGIVAWSYTGEMATAFQLGDPRVTLVAGLSTTLLNDWVFGDAAALEALDASKLTAAYAVLTERGDTPAIRPAILDRLASGYFVEFPGLAHGSFNALEGYIPSLFGLTGVQRWSRSSPAGVTGYEAAAAILSRLLRHHVEAGAARPLATVPLLTGIPPGTALLAQAPEPETVSFASGGTTLKGRLFAPAAGGPGVLLFPMCDGSGPAAWDPLARRLAARGFTVLALEYRPDGGMAAGRARIPLDQALAFWKREWAPDAQAALAYLKTRRGVAGAPIAAGGASCGVAVALNLAAADASVQTLALLAGPYDPALDEVVASRADLRVLSACDPAEAAPAAWMRQVAAASKHPASRFLEVRGAGHGTQMLARDPSLVEAIVTLVAAR